MLNCYYDTKKKKEIPAEIKSNISKSQNIRIENIYNKDLIL